jgi:hypothetical protein
MFSRSKSLVYRKKSDFCVKIYLIFIGDKMDLSIYTSWFPWMRNSEPRPNLPCIFEGSPSEDEPSGKRGDGNP